MAIFGKHSKHKNMICVFEGYKYMSLDDLKKEYEKLLFVIVNSENPDEVSCAMIKSRYCFELINNFTTKE